MPRWFMLLALPVALAFFCLSLGVAAREMDPTVQFQRAEEVRHAAEMNRIAEAAAAADAARNAQFWQSVTPAAALAAIVGLLGAVGLGLGLWALLLRDRRDFVVVAGVPVSRDLALAGATLPAMMTTVRGHALAQVEAARNPAPALPPGLRSYSPRYANRVEGPGARGQKQLPAPAAPVGGLPAPVEAPAIPAPAWAAIAASGLLERRDGDWLVGFALDGQPVLSPGWSAWVHAAIAGLSRSGKSNTARLMLAQASLRGMRLVVFDPHAAHPDGVGRGLEAWPSLLAPVAVTPGDMHALAREINGWLDGGRGSGEETLIVVDEWTRLLDGGTPPDVRETLTRAAAGIVTSGAKFGLHLCVIGQGWTVDAASPVRNGLQMAYLHKLRQDQARLVTNARPPVVDSLPRGRAALWHEGQWQHVGLPLITADDMRQVATLPRGVVVEGREVETRSRTVLDGSRTAEPPVLTPTAQNGSPEPRFPIEPRALTDAEIQAVRRMRAEGMSLTAICQAVFGYKNGETWPLITAVVNE